MKFVINNGEIMTIINLKEKGIAARLSESDAAQLTNNGQLLAVKAGMTFSDAIQITNTWQGQRI